MTAARHCRPRRRLVPHRVLIALALMVGAVSSLVSSAGASASTYIPRWHAYLDALGQKGCWYQWGSAGPCWHGYDCSGLVYWAYKAVGMPYFGRSTYQMLSSGRIRRISWSEARAGDLAFFGTGHVELYTGHWGWTFGALNSGTRVGYHLWNQWWHPTAVYRVIGAG